MADEIKKIYEQFNTNIDLIYSLLNKSIKLYDDNTVKYDKNLHYKVVESCFVDVFNCWESFLENTFIYYLLGHQNLKGESYKCYAKPKDKKHAYNIIKGIRAYPKWTEFQELSCLSGLYFEDHGPFACLEENPLEINEVKNIRNFISHKSEKSKQVFQQVLIRNLSIKDNINAAEYLLKIKTKEKITYFAYYTEFLRLYVDRICVK